MEPTAALHRTTPDADRRRWCGALAAGLGATATLGLPGCTLLRGPGPGPVVGPGEVPPMAGALGPDGLPLGWQPHVMRRDRRPTVYTPQRRDGRVVMHALADRSTSGLRCDVDIDPQATPWLSWSWRVDRFPDGTAIADDERDDSPARVVLAFDGDLSRLSLRDRLFHDQVELFTGQALPYATLMYSWDSASPLEAVLQYPRSSRIRYLVVEQGLAATGRWVHYRRQVADDFRRVFGEPPGRIRHVGILADSDDLQARVESWFGDLTFAAG